METCFIIQSGAHILVQFVRTNRPFQGGTSGIDPEAQSKHGPFETQGNDEVSCVTDPVT